MQKILSRSWLYLVSSDMCSFRTILKKKKNNTLNIYAKIYLNVFTSLNLINSNKLIFCCTNFSTQFTLLTCFWYSIFTVVTFVSIRRYFLVISKETSDCYIARKYRIWNFKRRYLENRQKEVPLLTLNK